jgi:hypothetical protein
VRLTARAPAVFLEKKQRYAAPKAAKVTAGAVPKEVRRSKRVFFLFVVKKYASVSRKIPLC